MWLNDFEDFLSDFLALLPHVFVPVAEILDVNLICTEQIEFDILRKAGLGEIGAADNRKINWAGFLGDLKSLNNLAAKQVFQKMVYTLILALITIEVLFLFNYMVGNRAQSSAVTSADYKAFIWIRNNTDENATFFVSIADAGQWITPIAQRRTYPMFTSYGDFIYSEEEFNKLNNLGWHMVKDPTSEEALFLLKSFEIDYVYIGKKTIYDRQSLNSSRFLGGRNYVPVYSDGNVWIFRIIYC